MDGDTTDTKSVSAEVDHHPGNKKPSIRPNEQRSDMEEK